ncbi:MAG: TadE/TadG family type IV pilus assembly protein [Acidimicrobiia bacterium]|nr:TadE/TadG family type IV pilus assembly protein [Acidimicrobiia bacterium]
MLGLSEIVDIQGEMRAGQSGGRTRLGKRDEGASLVEFAFVLPFLLLLILGMVELSFLFAQYNEVRHGVREGARYAAVSRPGAGDFNTVVATTCDAIGLPNAGLTVELAPEPGSSNPPARLDYATITVTASTNSLTNLPFFSSLVPSQLTNEATFRLEQDSGWGNGGGPTACP